MRGLPAPSLRPRRFSYPTRPDAPALRNFNLVVPAGHTVAIVGESGSGKSSVIALVERFYDAQVRSLCAAASVPPDCLSVAPRLSQSGSITVDGVPLRDLNVSWWRDHVGLVQQEPTLWCVGGWVVGWLVGGGQRRIARPLQGGLYRVQHRLRA